MIKVGIIGAGVMGRGVAQCLAQSSVHVVLLDISEEILEKARDEIYNHVRLQALFKKSEALEAPDIVISRITFSMDYDLLKDVDFIIENATEKWDVKMEIYKRIDRICKDECIFAVNTSCLSITRIASLTGRPDKVIGTHFMNPVPMIHTVETIRGYHTSENTIEKTKKLFSAMGKDYILVNDFPGFVSNRISHLLMNEAAFIVQDQVASPQDVDDIFVKCYGHKMGPLETADLIGLDTVVYSLDVLYDDFQDSKFRCCPLLRKMVDAGLLGRKSGQGFYSY
jgi:3-hydroxybutyryl-CoA dehydrogenase